MAESKVLKFIVFFALKSIAFNVTHGFVLPIDIDIILSKITLSLSAVTNGVGIM